MKHFPVLATSEKTPFSHRVRDLAVYSGGKLWIGYEEDDGQRVRQYGAMICPKVRVQYGSPDISARFILDSLVLEERSRVQRFIDVLVDEQDTIISLQGDPQQHVFFGTELDKALLTLKSIDGREASIRLSPERFVMALLKEVNNFQWGVNTVLDFSDENLRLPSPIPFKDKVA